MANSISKRDYEWRESFSPNMIAEIALLKEVIDLMCEHIKSLETTIREAHVLSDKILAKK